MNGKDVGDILIREGSRSRLSAGARAACRGSRGVEGWADNCRPRRLIQIMVPCHVRRESFPTAGGAHGKQNRLP